MKSIKVKNSSEIPQNYTGVVEWPDGTKEWVVNGEYHREDGPAVERADGSKCWYLNGLIHREYGPAVETADGYKEWWLNGKHHREDGPAVEYSSGRKVWYLNDKCLFRLPPESQPFIFIEEIAVKKGKGQIKVLTQQGIEIWPNLPGLKSIGR